MNVQVPAGATALAPVAATIGSQTYMSPTLHLVPEMTIEPTQQALTEIEALGLASQYDLANGHASQELAPSQQRIINSLPQLWQQGASQKSRDAEMMFKNAFSKLAQAPSLANYEYYKICPTASNSIDTVATWLAEKNLSTALIEPTFDNLYLILKRRGVTLTALPEESLYDGSYATAFKNVDALFLVNPNNPTGKVLNCEQFAQIVNWCAVNNKVIVMDNTFRFFAQQAYDTYKILLDSGVTFLSIEDTGKVWPTQEIKASLLFCSQSIFQEIHIIYDEIFLCASNFALGILSEFLLDAHARGLAKAVWNEVELRRKIFRKAIEGTILGVHQESLPSTISVEWVQIQSHLDNDSKLFATGSQPFTSDLELSAHFNAHNLVLLPGRQFYWSKKGEQAVPDSVRFALLKPKKEFLAAVDFLGNELRRLQSWL